MKILNRIGGVLVVLSTVVIAAALSVSAATHVLQRIDSAAFYERTSNLMGGGEGEVREVEVTSFVYDTSAHFTGEAGEEVTVNLSDGVWEVLGGGGDDLNIQTRLSSDLGSTVMTWTGFRNVISVLPEDEAEAMMDHRGVMPAGPMTLTVSGDQPWMVDFRRVVCPGDYEPF